MSRRARIGLVVASVLLALVALLVPEEDERLHERTTYGTMAWGFRASHDLLVELGFPVVRHHEPAEDLPAGATAWWLAPARACRWSDQATDEPSWLPRAWVEAGGTAVVFLADQSPDRPCTLETHALPLRASSKDKHGDAILTDAGPARRLQIPKLLAFVDGADWHVSATYADRPLVLERRRGDGLLVAVADASVLENRHLADADTAPFVVDLVRAFGVPHIVENPLHASGHSSSAIAYLATSPAAAMLAGLLAMGLLIAWRGNLIPARTIDTGGPAAATLQTFVDSLARLYAGTDDHHRVLVRYRELTAARLRRHLRLPAHTSLEAIVERLGRGRPLAHDPRALLLGPPAVATAADLRAEVGRLDALATEVIG